MRKINVSLSPSGINRTIQQLEKYRDSIEPKAKEVCERLVDNVIPIVEFAYMEAKANSESRETYTIRRENYDHGCKLVADGSAVAFWEFGAGVSAGREYPQEYTGGVDTSPGSWSQSELGKKHFDLANHPYWYWNGNRYSGLEPSFGMYKAAKDIEKHAERELKRAFK